MSSAKIRVMILEDLRQIGRHAAQNAGFAKAAQFLADNDYASLEDGCHEIDAGNVFALISSAPGKGRDKAVLEAHRKYIDIQFCVSGHDEIGIRPLQSCEQIRKKYDANKDIMFFADPPLEWIMIKDNTCAIIFPDDAHAPMAAEGPMKKVVIKIAVTQE
jgi:biofilm protein TabA